jgi:hypothetical protein
MDGLIYSCNIWVVSRVDVRGTSLDGALKPEALYRSLKLCITVSAHGARSQRPVEPHSSVLAGGLD